MARARGARSQLALVFEDTYGTAPGSGYTKMPFTRETLGTEQTLAEDDLLGYGRDPLAPILEPATSDGEIGIPIEATSLGFWLKALFGAPATVDNGDGTYTHTFISGAWGLPSLAIEVGLPDVPRYEMFTGCVAESLTWDMGREGQLTGTVAVVAQGSAPGTSSSAGTPADITRARFGHFNGSIKREGSALANIVSAQIAYSNNLERIESIRDDGLIDGADPGKAALTGSLEARFADTTLIDQAIAGTPCSLEFAYSRSSGEAFKLTAHEVYLPRPRVPVEGPQGVQASFDWQAAFNSSAGQMCTAVLTNTTASY